MNNSQSQNRVRQASCFVYTYHLPYGIRRAICNLLDADQSWKALGGHFLGLDATQLTLIGQAYMRNGSPTDELLNKLDSANVRVTELCFYLRQLGHCRALEILKPYANNGTDFYQPGNDSMDTSQANGNSTLTTPTPSFADQLPAIMGCNDLNSAMDPQHWLAVDDDKASSDKRSHQNQADRCHKSTPRASTQLIQSHQQKISEYDPGEEIVRMACTNNRNRTSISDQEVVNQLRLIMQINYNELKQASNDFSDSNILGNGGFASVYRGHWKGTDVAIKRLKCNLMDQALNELTILNSYRIDNILPIYGISIDGPEACLVYQFMANGSLEDRLSCKKGTAPLSWNQRALIGEGVAKGLFYLHTLRDKPLVHGDVKSANVLLDSQFVPKLGDFGLARQVFKGKNPNTEHCTHVTVSSIHGTSVYLPPEYLRHKILSPAVDVYSYGIVLLEMATGRRAYDGKRLLIDIVDDETRSLSIGQIGYSLKDSRLANDTHNDLKIWYELLIKLGLNCAHKIKKKRLDMGQVLDRYSEFRANFNLDVGSNNNSMFGPLHSNDPTMARILTPDLTTFDKKQQIGFEDAKINRNLGVRGDETGSRTKPPTDQTHHSALMSVEEEDLKYMDQPEVPREVIHKNPDRSESAVEAMIPLLTELGVVTNQD